VTPAFFVVGTGRCGTNLFRTILLAHADVYVARETHWIPHLVERFGDRAVAFSDIYDEVQRVYMPNGITAFDRIARQHQTSGPELWAHFQRLQPAETTGTIADFMSAYYALLAELNGTAICGDKTPDYGVHMTSLAALWPQTRFIHIYRDGRDVALSMRKVRTFQHLVAAGKRDWLELAVDRKFEEDAEATERELPLAGFFELWRRRFTAIRAESRLLPEDRYLEVRYEELLSSPGPVLDAIGRFSGIYEPEHRGARRGGRLTRQWRNLRWRQQASRLIRPSNLGRNAQSDEHAWLGRTYGETLDEMTASRADARGRLRGCA
jgi:hypothetical protein